MPRLFDHDFSPYSRKVRSILLAFTFLCGMILGCVIYQSAELESVRLMRSAVHGPVSIVGLLIVVLLPFLFSAVAVYISKPCLLLGVAFCKGLFFSLVSMGVMGAYGSAGWLMRFLLMFTDIVSMPVLVFFWLHSGVSGRISLREILVILAICVCICGIDARIISPVLMGL